MRIAHVNQDPGIDPERHKGAAVHVAAMRNAFKGVGADVTPIDEPDPVRGARALERAHALAPIDLVYERYALNRFDGSAFARRHDVPFVLEVNAPLAEEEGLYRDGKPGELDLKRDAELFRTASLVLAVSQQIADYAVERGAPRDRTLVRPNGVDSLLFRPRSAKDPELDRRTPPGRVVVGFHGRLRPWHNFGLLVEAFERLLPRSLPLHLLIVGEGRFEEELGGRIPKDQVTRVGWCPHEELAELVACFDVLPLMYAPDRPCYFSPLKLLEAMACGAVPIVPNLGDLPRTVPHGHRGLVYSPGDVDALATSIEELACSEPLRCRLSHAALQHARQNSWRSIARDVLAHTLSEVGG